MKKIIALLLTAVMLVGLVACASKTTDTPKEETTTESTETAKTEETAMIIWIRLLEKAST